MVQEAPVLPLRSDLGVRGGRVRSASPFSRSAYTRQPCPVVSSRRVRGSRRDRPRAPDRRGPEPRSRRRRRAAGRARARRSSEHRPQVVLLNFGSLRSPPRSSSCTRRTRHPHRGAGQPADRGRVQPDALLRRHRLPVQGDRGARHHQRDPPRLARDARAAALRGHGGDPERHRRGRIGPAHPARGRRARAAAGRRHQRPDRARARRSASRPCAPTRATSTASSASPRDASWRGSSARAGQSSSDASGARSTA